MRRLIQLLLLGKLIETAVLFLILGLNFIWKFYDSFYGDILVQPIMGRRIPWIGFILSTAIALLLGYIAETNKGWDLISRCLRKIPLMEHLVNLVDQWKRFSKHAYKHGVVLAPYYRKDSTFWPGIVTNLVPTEDDGLLVTVTFAKITGPEPSMLTEEEKIFLSLTPREAFAYVLSGGLALKLYRRKLKKTTLGQYIRSSPELMQDILRNHEVPDGENQRPEP